MPVHAQGGLTVTKRTPIHTGSEFSCLAFREVGIRYKSRYIPPEPLPALAVLRKDDGIKRNIDSILRIEKELKEELIKIPK